MSDSSDAQRRAYFRLRYPQVDRPLMDISGEEYEVLEISESGARIKVHPNCSLVVGQAFVGMLRFRDGAAATVQGKLSRVDANEAALRLSAGITLSRMLVEQRQLAHRHLNTQSQPDSEKQKSP